MDNVSIIDLFWLILKFLAALGLVCLLTLVVYLISRFVFTLLRNLPNVLSGKAGVAITVAWVLIVVGIATLATFWYNGVLNTPSNPQH